MSTPPSPAGGRADGKNILTEKSVPACLINDVVGVPQVHPTHHFTLAHTGGVHTCSDHLGPLRTLHLYCVNNFPEGWRRSYMFGLCSVPIHFGENSHLRLAASRPGRRVNQHFRLVLSFAPLFGGVNRLKF